MWPTVFSPVSFCGVVHAGIDVTSKYDDASQIRNQVLDDMIDPIAKKILTYASESNLDEIIGSTIAEHEDGI